MAGNYPDVPGPRLAYDRDGSVGFRHTGSGAITVLTNAQMIALNDESSSGDGEWGGGYWGIIFPELRDIIAFGTELGSAGGFIGVETSTDTTNGLDGTWTTKSSGSILNGSAGGAGTRWHTNSPNYRTGIFTSSISGSNLPYNGIKAIRFSVSSLGGDSHWYGCHLYGKVTSGQTPDRLRLWHPTLDQALDDQAVSPDGAYFDWGNVAQGTTFDRTFRIKNNSSSLTANTVTVSTESLSPLAIPDVLTLSKDGITFTSIISFTSIASGVITAVCTLRRTTPSNASLGLAVKRMNAVAASWS